MKKNRNSAMAKDELLDHGQNNILKGVCICLTGLPIGLKEDLHSLVAHHGGKFTRDLLTHKTTHLIAKVPEGDKFNEAVKCGSIEIVSPGWLYACHKEQIRVATHSYCLIKSVGFDQANGHYQKKKKNSSLKEHKSCSGSSDLDLESTCSTLLHRSPIPLFSNSYLFFAGFGDRSLSVDFWCSNSTSTRENENCDKQIKGANDSSPQSLLRALLRLTRISMGTILWDLNENASHIILHQSCDKDLRNAISNFCRLHPRCPKMVSPRWIVESVYHMKLQPSELYFPEEKPLQQQIKRINDKKKFQQTAVERNAPRKSALFSGALFHVIKMPPQSQALVNFDDIEIRKIITEKDGLLLSAKVWHSLEKESKVDSIEGHSQAPNPGSFDGVCFVVSLTGDYSHDRIINSNPLLMQVNQSSYKIVPVTPVWLKTCVYNKVRSRPDKYPLLFQPQGWSMRKLPDNVTIKVSVTGFLGNERTGMQMALQVIGAEYTENMRSSNTHLICKEARGEKFKKAIEWGIHIISEKWLYDVLQYGYTNCEKKFSLIKDKQYENLHVDEVSLFSRKENLKVEKHTTNESNSGISLEQESQSVLSKNVSNVSNDKVRNSLNRLEKPLARSSDIISNQGKNIRKRHRCNNRTTVLMKNDNVGATNVQEFEKFEEEDDKCSSSEDDEKLEFTSLKKKRQVTEQLDSSNAQLESQAIWYGNSQNHQ